MDNNKQIQNLELLKHQYSIVHPKVLISDHLEKFPEHILCYHGHGKIDAFGVIKLNHTSTRFPTYICFDFIINALKKLKQISVNYQIQPKLAILFTDCWAECSLDDLNLIIEKTYSKNYLVSYLNPDKFLHHQYR